jgi:hypothetical protein
MKKLGIKWKNFSENGHLFLSKKMSRGKVLGATRASEADWLHCVVKSRVIILGCYHKHQYQYCGEKYLGIFSHCTIYIKAFNGKSCQKCPEI